VKILVVYANGHGAMHGSAERIAETLRRSGGLDVTVSHADAAERLGQYDAFVIGGATHRKHWLNEAARFVRAHHSLLASRPVWLYCSRAAGTRALGSELRDGAGCSAPLEFDEFATMIRPRDARVFQDACDGAAASGVVRRLAERARARFFRNGGSQPGFRDAEAVEAWADGIARAFASDCAPSVIRQPRRGIRPIRRSTARLAAEITKAASHQTYYTIRILVDRPRMDDAYRAYAYFRWVDDILDAETQGPARASAERITRRRFLERQQSLMERCLRGEPPPREIDLHEAMLVDLVGSAGSDGVAVETYLRHMMRVMDFDLGRRGRLVSEAELNDYTKWLAVAVTESMHHFIGNGSCAPDDPSRYAAASGAHILHMLRDTFVDLRAGYWNVPGEVLAAHAIEPEDVHSAAYRAWVAARVQLASKELESGRAYLARVESARHRLAGLAYIARFEWLIETLTREDFWLRPTYANTKTFGAGLRATSRVLSSMLDAARPTVPSSRIDPLPETQP
jgi:hypothetical protein